MIRYLLIVLSLLILSCKPSPEENQQNDLIWKKIKESKNFLDYVSFMRKNPLSNHFENALNLYFEKRELYWKENMPPAVDCFSNCGQILIDSLGEITFEDDIIKKDTLSDFLLKFLVNEQKKVTWPNNREITDSKGIKHTISKGAFEIIFDKRQIEKLKFIVSEINHSFEKYKEFLSNEWFDKKFEDLDKDDKYLLDSLLEYRLTFWKLEDIRVPPPPPPMENIYENEN